MSACACQLIARSVLSIGNGFTVVIDYLTTSSELSSCLLKPLSFPSLKLQSIQLFLVKFCWALPVNAASAGFRDVLQIAFVNVLDLYICPCLQADSQGTNIVETIPKVFPELSSATPGLLDHSSETQ